MVIELKDLQIGDEIIISSGPQLKYLKVLRPVRLNGKKSYCNNVPLYSRVYCAARREEKEYKESYPRYRGTNTPIILKRKEFICSPDSNTELYQNLNGKTIWLVKREKQ